MTGRPQHGRRRSRSLAAACGMPALPRSAFAAAATLALACVLVGHAPHARGQTVQPPREGQRVDDRRPEQPLSVDLFGRPLQFTGSWEYSDEWRRNFDLNLARDRDRRVREHELKLEARWLAGPDTEFFVQAVALHESRSTQGTTGTQRTRAWERGQTWVRISDRTVPPVSLQVGRVAVVDRRAWWWDDDLDALRLQVGGESMRLDTGIARELARVSSAEPRRADNDKVSRWFGQVTFPLPGRHAIDAFWLLQRDRSGTPPVGSVAGDEDATDPSDVDARWLGLRASGQFRPDDAPAAVPRLTYWADVARLLGREAVTPYGEDADGRFNAGATTRHALRSHAVDFGLTAIWSVPLRPSLSVAYARGSGGGLADGTDRTFRQTGLHENKGRVAGVKRVRYYGELLQPELSNLQVTTLGAGIRLLGNSSLELLAHRYRQLVPSTTLRAARPSTDPLGSDGDIGREIDLALAVREWREVELTLKWSQFRPGTAYAADRRDAAHAVEFGAAFNF